MTQTSEAASTQSRPISFRFLFVAIVMFYAVGYVFSLGVGALSGITRIITYLVVAGFVAVVLNPAVDLLEQRLRLRRGLSAVVVFITGIVVFFAMLYTFISPVIRESQQFVEHIPQYTEDVQAGRGAVGRLVQKYNLERYVEQNEARLNQTLNRAGAQALGLARTVGNTIAALVTILVLAFLMVLKGPEMLKSSLKLFPRSSRVRIEHVAADSAKAVTGYMAGNLLISAVAAVVTYLALWAFGVPFRGVLALWVGFADLIPLVGATLGAIPTIIVAFLSSTTAGFGMLAVYIIYQQFENHVLQVSIMSKTVNLNPLTVLVSVLIGVDLFGIVGALLAIPAAGVIQVIVRDIYDEHEEKMKDVPTVGTDEVPINIDASGDASGEPDLQSKADKKRHAE